MWPIPRKLLSWVEPKEFIEVQRQFVKQSSAKTEMLLYFGLFALCWPVWALKAWLNQPHDPWWLILTGSTGGVMLLWVFETYIHPWIEAKFEFPVEIRTTGIGRHTPRLEWVVTFRKLRSFVIYDIEDYHVLEITDHREKQVLIGIPLSVDIMQLEQILMEHGLSRQP